MIESQEVSGRKRRSREEIQRLKMGLSRMDAIRFFAKVRAYVANPERFLNPV
jgi:hypothetical protein